MKYTLYITDEFAESKDDLKESIKIYGPYKMATTLHSLDIINSISISQFMLSNLQHLSNIHLASLLVEKLSQDIQERKKYVAFQHFLKQEPSLIHIYYKMSFLSKSLNMDIYIVYINLYNRLGYPNFN